MKINYYNENYENNVYTIIIIILLIVVITIWGIINKLTSNIGILILCTTSNIMLLIPLIIGIKQYKRKKEQRNLNLYIIKNGICIPGKIVSIYDRYSREDYIDNSHIYHNITAEIEYYIDNELKKIIVDKLMIKLKEIKEYENKDIKIYIYNNMSYIDVKN